MRIFFEKWGGSRGGGRRCCRTEATVQTLRGRSNRKRQLQTGSLSRSRNSKRQLQEGTS
ncbi:hypothetical protein [Methanimicrococcus hongohii]|uniref:hypothetical protein n=1 Tax=Methanimicrococcus hongohii TaxID=3028295 RepID=UPI00293153B1|nr:hypothetical protein [Methanimicrococcus sp. Hf6]